MKIFILAQTQELQLPSPVHQEHFYCHQRHFRHLPQLQRARERQLRQEFKSPGFPMLFLLTLRRTHTRSAGALCRAGHSHCVCQDHSAHRPCEVVTALPSFLLHYAFTARDGAENSQGDSVLMTHAEADYAIPKPWDWNNSAAHPRVLEML